MTYEPDLSAAPAPAPNPADNQFYDLAIASNNFWAGHTGRELPPAPSYRKINGKLMLGRYMDPFGCQAHMRSAKIRWSKWYTEFFVAAGIGVVVGVVDWVFWLLVLPILVVVYFHARRRHQRQYDLYYGVQERIIATGQPEWVPFDKDKLKLIDEVPDAAVWP